jgi:hypothetical protein
VKIKYAFILAGLTACAAGLATASRPQPSIAGDYLEVRSCDVFTGSCVANAEMGLSGREGMMVWSIRAGSWQGTKLDGLKVIAVVRTDNTLGDMRYQPLDGRAVLIVDEKANRSQREALIEFVKSQAGSLVKSVAAVKFAPIESAVGTCASGSCARVKAGSWVEISTRCLGGKDHLCGNEENFYPPLTTVEHPLSVFTELASFQSPELNATWEMTDKRSAYVASFAR